MWIGPMVAAAAAIALALSKPAALAVAGPILGLWLASPGIAWWISRPLAQREARLTANQILFLRKLSRKTWAFFETFVGPEDHWLPPDNYQEHPASVIAHRTSPTNMGLALLANLSAYDFGYLSAGKLIERTAKALHTMEGLERHQGHFYNWYDTRSLKPLPPLYISSVDSGNLAGHLLTLRPGLLGLADQKILGARFFESVSDTLGIFMDAAAAAPDVYAPARLVQLQQDLESATRSKPSTLTASRLCLDQLARSAASAAADVEALDADRESPLKWWARAFAGQCRDALDELTSLAPWAELLPSQDNIGGFPDLDEIPTLGELAALEEKLLPEIDHRLDSASTSAESAWIGELQRRIATASQNAGARIATIKGLALQCDVLARMDYDFLFDKTRHLLAIGYNVGEHRRDSSYYDLLASEARLCQLRGHCAGAAAAGELVCPGASAHHRRRRTDPPLLERFDVRIPDAAPGDADLRTHAARPDLQGGGGPADRVWEKTRGAVGHFGMRLQCHRCASQLPIPCLRRTRPGAQTRARRGSGDCALRLGAGADGGAREGLSEPRAPRR